MEKWSRDELDHIVKCTRDPSSLPPGMLDQMEAAKVGPFAHRPRDWQAAFDKAFVECRLQSFERDQTEMKRRFPRAGIK
jgi:hypothetical protein